eukprot:1804610-Rhodomonas_salina.1
MEVRSQSLFCGYAFCVPGLCILCASTGRSAYWGLCILCAVGLSLCTLGAHGVRPTTCSAWPITCLWRVAASGREAAGAEEEGEGEEKEEVEH